MRRVSDQKSKAGQYFLSHQEAVALEKMRRKERKPIRRQQSRSGQTADGRSLRELIQIVAIAVLVLLVLYLVL